MLKVIFMAKETESSKAALKYLVNTDIEIVRAVIRKNDEVMRTICSEYNIATCTESDLLSDYKENKLIVDYILSFYWKKINQEVLNIPVKGSINFHPGPLPEARGSGYHMAILENWGYWGVTAHFMDAEFDTGPIIECRRFEIDKKIINKDLVDMAHKQLYLLFISIIYQIKQGNKLETIAQKDGRYFSLKDLENRKLILDSDSDMMIERKIRAFWNPPHSGAQIKINDKMYTLIDQKILEWIANKINL
jgi:methionyl-tRNA formyltransferase